MRQAEQVLSVMFSGAGRRLLYALSPRRILLLKGPDMKRRSILALVMSLAAGAICAWTSTAIAEPLGSAFAYQGYLLDADNPANDRYDIQFILFDSPYIDAVPLSAVDVNDLEVIDGHLLVDLDFGPGLFDGNSRWLEMAVRLHGSTDPNAYTTSGLRQQLTPIPYALYAQTAGPDADWGLSGNNLYSLVSGMVGIGTSRPTQKLDVAGTIQMTGFRMPTGAGSNFLLTSDASGKGSWRASTYIGGSGTTNYVAKFVGSKVIGNSVIYETGRNIGIGTTSVTSGAKLEVAGQVKITGGSPGTGKVLTCDASGLGSWQTPVPFPPGTTGQTLRYSGTAWVANSVLFNNGTNIGVGTTSPAHKLDVAGGIAVDNYLQARTDNGLALRTDDATVRLSITDAGNVGVGITGPGHKLHVAGGIGVEDYIQGTTSSGLALKTGGSTTSAYHQYRQRWCRDDKSRPTPGCGRHHKSLRDTRRRLDDCELGQKTGNPLRWGHSVA
jgi:hypothetical protein